MDKSKAAERVDLARVNEIVARIDKKQRWPLIPLLQQIHNDFGYIPPESIPVIARAVGLSSSQVQGVITFYANFYMTPRGKNIVRVCRGTACHVRGGKTILKLVKQHLGVEEGETTPDYEYSLETVACIGVCALAPNIVINRQTHGQMNPKKVSKLLGKKGGA